MSSSYCIFDGGPFLEAYEDAATFGMNLYFYTCLGDSLEAHTKAQKEYEQAVLAKDEEKMARKKGEVTYYENILLLASSMINARQDMSQSQ
tara:strand:- start:873 stop:1145 length:273 start_codon:yes stop_codon:yes gene_type:complete